MGAKAYRCRIHKRGALMNAALLLLWHTYVTSIGRRRR
jgi:hypothetical protein